MTILKIRLGKERQCHITKQLVHSFSVNIRISQPSKVMYIGFASMNITFLGLTNPDVNLKRMQQLYNDIYRKPIDAVGRTNRKCSNLEALDRKEHKNRKPSTMICAFF